MADDVVRLAQVHYPVTALGPGRRVGIWFHGCSLHCAGCMSRDTWAGPARVVMTVDDLLASHSEGFATAEGVTISGGEPFEQPDGLLALLQALRSFPHLSVIVYSGLALEALRAGHAERLALIDVLISDPFIASQAISAPLRGSANQRVSCLSARGEALWRDVEEDWCQRGARLDLIADDAGAIWFAGVPAPGDLDRLDQRFYAAGIFAWTSAGRLGGKP